jgi:L-ascorbate metabolism protein UlaG (beta-lactamase superfamily)
MMMKNLLKSLNIILNKIENNAKLSSLIFFNSIKKHTGRLFILAIIITALLLLVSCQKQEDKKDLINKLNNSNNKGDFNMHEYKLNENATLYWLSHAGFKIKTNGKTIYIDPYEITDTEPADIVLITHSHYDHCSIADLLKIVKNTTTILATADCTSMFAGKVQGKMQLVTPNKILNVGGIDIETVPAYNINKQFHPKENGWVGYIINAKGTKVYHAGDTDLIPEMEKIKADVALLPIGGTYTMDAKEAAKACSIINPKIAIPMHYGKIVGTKASAEEFKKASSCTVLII